MNCSRTIPQGTEFCDRCSSKPKAGRNESGLQEWKELGDYPELVMSLHFAALKFAYYPASDDNPIRRAAAEVLQTGVMIGSKPIPAGRHIETLLTISGDMRPFVLACQSLAKNNDESNCELVLREARKYVIAWNNAVGDLEHYDNAKN
jgi:hypothetical protein